MDFLFWIVGIVIVLGLVYKFWPKGRAKIDELGDKIDRRTDNDGDGPFR